MLSNEQSHRPGDFCKVSCPRHRKVHVLHRGPFSKKPVQIAKGMRDRKMQRALMQFFKAENYFAVREALIEAGRGDLIGGCEGLIPAQPPKEAIEARRRQANRAVSGDDGDHYPHRGEGGEGEGAWSGEQGIPGSRNSGGSGRKKADRRHEEGSVTTLFVVDDPYEVLALLRALFAAKFHAPEDGLELAGSPILARLCERAMGAFVAVQEAGLLPGNADRNGAGFRSLVPGAVVVGSVRRHLAAIAARPGNWNRWSPDERADYVRLVFHPYVAEESLVQELASAENL